MWSRWKSIRKALSLEECYTKGSNPEKPGNNCYNIQFAFRNELKTLITGFVRSGNTYTENGAAELIKEIVSQIKTDDYEILFRMDSGYFDDDIIKTIELSSCQYLIMRSAQWRGERISNDCLSGYSAKHFID